MHSNRCLSRSAQTVFSTTFTMRGTTFWVASGVTLVLLYVFLLSNSVGSVNWKVVYPKTNSARTVQLIASTQLGFFSPLKTHSYEVPAPHSPTHQNWSTVTRALDTRSKMAGFRQKAGILNPPQWMREYKHVRENETLEWLDDQPGEGAGCHAAQPPWQYPGCLVHINHHYKFIWIKGKKVGGTAIREPLGWICNDAWRTPSNADQSLCSERLNANSQITLEEAKMYWRSYFVFGFVRNPYARFASGYEYVQRYALPKARVPFHKVCRDPFFLSRRSRRRHTSNVPVAEHVHHIMEQSSCFFTEDGLPAVDFIGQTESLGTDLSTVLQEINARKPEHLPQLKIQAQHLRKRNSNPDDRYDVKLYRRNSKCLGEVEYHFCEDFHRLGYDLVTSQSSQVDNDKAV